MKPSNFSEKHKLVAENAGVLPLAGLRRLQDKGKKIVCVISGGNRRINYSFPN